jgi:hypothetical protein
MKVKINNLDDLVKILTPEIFIELCNSIAIWDSNAETWDDICFDYIDKFEFIMLIENKYNCDINDIFADNLYREVSPKSLYQLLISYKRNEGLLNLGII